MGRVKIVLRQPQDSFKIVSEYLLFDFLDLLDPLDFFKFLDFLVKTALIKDPPSRQLQQSFKTAYRPPQDSFRVPGTARDRPRQHPDRPRPPSGGPRSPQEAPTTAQDRPQTASEKGWSGGRRGREEEGECKTTTMTTTPRRRISGRWEE